MGKNNCETTVDVQAAAHDYARAVEPLDPEMGWRQEDVIAAFAAGYAHRSSAVYTLLEAATHLRLTNRGVAKLARQHGLCMVRGRDILFTDADIEGIKDALRCPSNSTSAAKSGGSPALSTDKKFEKLLAATTKKSRRRSGVR